MELIETLKLLGIELPSAAYVVGAVLFGIVGMVAFWKGRKLKRPRVKWLGVALMFYPYLVWNTALLYAAGVGLCVALWVNWRIRRPD
jgi:hypothetical protein